jgi:hypothetical protein
VAERALPWWAPPFPPMPVEAVSFADIWDALFGRLETFCKVELDGSWFICEAKDLADYELPERDGDGWCVTAPGGDHYTITRVRMTRREFNNLPEFEGF